MAGSCTVRRQVCKFGAGRLSATVFGTCRRALWDFLPGQSAGAGRIPGGDRRRQNVLGIWQDAGEGDCKGTGFAGCSSSQRDGKGHCGNTYALFGCGVDICYPNYHRQLYDEIERHGGLLSEYLPGTKPLPAYFSQRNRLISILSDVALIIEAKEKSGSLITADFALEQGRDVYALPGRVTDRLSYGCNRLIAQGAGIILSVEDCLAELSMQAVRKKEIVCKSALKTGNCEIFDNLQKFSLEKDERLVYGCLGLLPTGFETLLEKTGLDIQELSQILAALMLKRHIEEVYKNHYKIITE